MITKKTYYSISEVSNMLNIQEHTIRFWDSKLPNLSKRENKSKTRFFNIKQIEMLSRLNEILQKNDTLSLAFEVLSKNNNKSPSLKYLNIDNSLSDSQKFNKKFIKLNNISKNLKKLLN